MEESTKKYLFWIVGIIAIAIIFYILYPKYYFIRDGYMRCNTITGSCDVRTSNNSWKSFAK